MNFFRRKRDNKKTLILWDLGTVYTLCLGDLAFVIALVTASVVLHVAENCRLPREL